MIAIDLLCDPLMLPGGNDATTEVERFGNNHGAILTTTLLAYDGRTHLKTYLDLLASLPSLSTGTTFRAHLAPRFVLYIFLPGRTPLAGQKVGVSPQTTQEGR